MPKTLTAEELIEQLQQVPPFTPIAINVEIRLEGSAKNNGGYYSDKLPVTDLHTVCNEVQLEARG